MLKKSVPLIVLYASLLSTIWPQQSFSLGVTRVPVKATSAGTAGFSRPQHFSRKDSYGIIGASAVMKDAPVGWTPNYTRGECMVQVKISKGGKPVTAAQWFDISFRAGSIFVFEAPKFGLASYDYRERSHSVYLLYAKHCDNRFNITQSLFTQMKNSIIRFPDFKVLHQTVSPSSETLDICGHWWKDGMEGDCYKRLSASRTSHKPTNQ